MTLTCLLFSGPAGIMAESLFNKKCICIITGASQGYGKCIAESFARTCSSGSLLILLSRNNSKVKEVAYDIHSNCPGITVVAQQLDLADLQQCSVENFQVVLNTYNIILGDFEHVILVHNAGSLGDVTKFVWQLTDKAVVENCITVNVTGTILFNAAVLDAVKKADVKSTVVVNISSLAALQAFPSWSLYCAGRFILFISLYPMNTVRSIMAEWSACCTCNPKVAYLL